MGERDAKGRFVAGNKCGTGRPKMPEEFRKRSREMAEDALERMYAIITDENSDKAHVIAACRFIIERAYGRSAIETEIEKRNELDAQIDKVDALLAAIDEIARQ